MKFSKSSTAEALSSYLFGHSKFPTWTGRFDELLVGIEVEYLIVHRDDSSRLMLRDEFNQLITALANHGFTKDHSSNQIGRVSKDAAPGYIVIEPDFAYHILEIAFPPRHEVEDIKAIIGATLEAVDQELEKIGFKRLESGILDGIIQVKFDTVNLERLDGFVSTLQNDASPSKSEQPLFLPNFGAYLAATHIHLNISSGPSSLTFFPALYELEWIAHSIFSHCRRFCGLTYGNARTLIYLNTFPASYKLVQVPEKVPASIVDLANLYEQSVPRLFKQETILGVKDMCSIRAKPFGTFEFRSACSMPTQADLLSVAAFRIAQFYYAQIYKEEALSRNGWQREAVLSIAKPEHPSLETQRAMQTSLKRFLDTIDKIPQPWQSYLPYIPATVDEFFILEGDVRYA